jgi:hypothetical protein
MEKGGNIGVGEGWGGGRVGLIEMLYYLDYNKFIRYLLSMKSIFLFGLIWNVAVALRFSTSIAFEERDCFG